MDQHIKSYEMPLQSQFVIDPLEKWALDFVGLINPLSHQNTYILVYTNYITKRVEAKELIRAIK